MARISAAVYPFTGFGIQRNAEAAPAAERKERRDEPEVREGISFLPDCVSGFYFFLLSSCAIAAASFTRAAS